jgi:hypothetical protein
MEQNYFQFDQKTGAGHGPVHSAIDSFEKYGRNM